MWPLLRASGRRLDRRVARRSAERDEARGRARARHCRRRGGCAIAAALSGRAGGGKIVAVVSGGNIDLARFAALVAAVPAVHADGALSPDHAPNRMSEERFAAAAPLPSRIHRLHELALDLWWSWTRAPARCSAGSTTRCGARSSHNPVRMLQPIDAAAAAAGRSGSASSSPLYDEAIAGLRRSRAARCTRGGRARPAAQRQGRSPISPPSSRCTSRCPSTPAASACWPAITARKRATSACRWSASASCTRRATSTSGSRPTAGRRSATSG